RPRDQASSEVRDEVPLEIELEDGTEIGPEAGVGAATVEDPDVPAVRVGVNPGDGSPFAARRKLCPVQIGHVVLQVDLCRCSGGCGARDQEGGAEGGAMARPRT